MLADLLINSVFKYYPNYEEDMSLTEELAENAKKCYLGFHSAFLENPTMRRNSTLFDLDSALERFSKRMRELVNQGNYDSMAILGDYLELNDYFGAVKKHILTHYK